MQSRQNLDSHIFKEFLQYDLASGSLWEIVEIFERHRANFREQVARYEEDISKAKEELKSLREQISQTQKELSQKRTQSLESKILKPCHSEALAEESPNQSHKAQPIEKNPTFAENKTPAQNPLTPNTMQQKILELELENKRLSIELRDLKQEIQLEKRERELHSANLSSTHLDSSANLNPNAHANTHLDSLNAPTTAFNATAPTPATPTLNTAAPTTTNPAQKAKESSKAL